MTDGNNNRWLNITNVKLPPIDKLGFKSAVLKRAIWEPDNNKKKTGVYIIRCRTNERICITKQKTVIGKGESADYKLEGNSAISREHAVLIQESDEFYIEDLNSLNHTYVKGNRINEKTQLFDSDIIGLADEEFVFYIDRDYL